MAEAAAVSARSGPPLEVRQFMPVYTPEHAAAGLQAIVQNVSGKRVAFCPAILQYRYREIVYVDGNKTTQWSEWQDVGFVREGIDDAPQGAADSVA